MEVKTLREVIICTACLKPKEITLVKLEECLEGVQSHVFPVEEATTDTLWKVAVRYFNVLTQFAEQGLIETQDKSADGEEVINLHDLAHYITAIDYVRQFTLHLYLPKELRGLSKYEAQMMVMVEEPERVRRLSHCVAQFRRLFDKKMLALHPRLEDCVVDFIAACYNLSNASLIEDHKLPTFPKERIFHSLLVIKGSPGLPLALAQLLHSDLLRLTGEPGGFPVLCRTLLTVGASNENTPAWHKSEVIAKIVCSKGHTKKFYRQVLVDCFEFYHWAVQTGTEEALVYAATCIECLKRFYQLPAAYRELHERIETHFFADFRMLAAPREIVTGCIVAERLKLVSNLLVCNMAFIGSTLTSLPSSLLVPYLHLFLKLYSMLPNALEEHLYLQNMIVFCLNNRSKVELQQIVNALLMGRSDGEIGRYILHPRMAIKHTENDTSYNLQIGPSANDGDTETDNLLPVLVTVLKASDRNLLIYDTFLILLTELMTGVWTDESIRENQLLDDVEREGALCSRFYQKYVLIQSLMDLISHRHFHTQLYDSPGEILQVLTTFLTKVIDGPDEANASGGHDSAETLEIVLSIFQEFLQRTRNRQEVDGILKLLERYKRTGACSDAMKTQINLLCSKTTFAGDGECETACQNALSLCSDQQPYCKVYGTTLLLKLLQERDPETLTQRHKILILALTNLRNEESYAFLNSVRLLVALCSVLEAEVVDALVKEYQNENNEVDYRLKIGEATVKTVETLGAFAVRYRDTLLNCFLAGTRHTVDEFRASSLSNVGSMCRILSYQVHNFFYEAFTTIQSIVTTDGYLPARRAAILVLSQLLEGIDGLMDFQEYLLLIYRFLKHVIATDRDDVTKLQAAVALDHLKAKTKDFLQINPDELERRMLVKVSAGLSPAQHDTGGGSGSEEKKV
uniref:RNA polymerase II assembly factor Rtp1 C-terminal domain-containing protein n=1 Tax=Anopheles dirus TaxID=7168 RepID=A0A182NE51_9DIPT